MPSPLETTLDVDVHAQVPGNIDKIKVVPREVGGVVSLSTSWGISAPDDSFIYAAVFGFDGNQIHPAICITSETLPGRVANPSVIDFGTKFLFFWHSIYEERRELRHRIECGIVRDDANFVNDDAANRQHDTILFENQLSDRYMVTSLNNNQGFVIAAPNVNGKMLLKRFDASIKLMASAELDVLYSEGRQQLVRIDNGVIMLDNHPDDGIRQITCNINLEVIDGPRIIIDKTDGNEITNFNTVRSNNGVISIACDNGVIEAITLGLDGEIMSRNPDNEDEFITTINDPASKLISLSPINSGIIDDGSIIIIQIGNQRYAQLLDQYADPHGDKFAIDNNISQIIPTDDGNFLAIKTDPETGHLTNAQIFHINYDAVPNFNPSPSISVTASPSETPATMSPSVALSFLASQTASITLSALGSISPTKTASLTSSALKSISPINQPIPDNDPNDDSILGNISKILFAIAGTIIVFMAVKCCFECRKKRRSLNNKSLELADVEITVAKAINRIKRFLIEEKENIREISGNCEDGNKKFYLLKDMLSLAMELYNKQDDNKKPYMTFIYRKSDNIFAIIKLQECTNNVISYQLEQRKSGAAPALLLNIKVTLSDKLYRELPKKEDLVTYGKLLDWQPFLGDLSDLMIRFNTQLIDSIEDCNSIILHANYFLESLKVVGYNKKYNLSGPDREAIRTYSEQEERRPSPFKKQEKDIAGQSDRFDESESEVGSPSPILWPDNKMPPGTKIGRRTSDDFNIAASSSAGRGDGNPVTRIRGRGGAPWS